jgi:dihydrofolate synthase/folylpolyglutamate synthase
MLVEEFMSPSIAADRCQSAKEFLEGRINYERASTIPYREGAFRLDRMHELMRRLGNPQDRLRIVHVAGTKGKGSTSAMIAAVLSAAGYRTGLYTSPHLERLEERFRIDGQPCSASELAALVDRVRPIVEQLDAAGQQCDPPEPGPTYFEITTAMALVHFAQAGTDAAILEVGLGGRLDSTNICQPQVSVITSISFDHMAQLGTTLAEIAGEKAGIIKPGVSVVSGVTDDEPRRVIAEVARKCGSRLIQLGVDFDFQYHPARLLDQPAESCSIDFQQKIDDLLHRTDDIKLGLLGRHQAANAAVTLAVLDELRAQGWRIPEEAIRHGLAELRWPARVEVISHNPTVILDAAHNTASIASLLETLQESFAARRRILIFATTQDKDVGGMLRLLLPQFENVIFTRYVTNPRAVAPDEMASMAADISAAKCTVCPDPHAAWQTACELTTPEDLICITGSFFLAAEMRTEFAPQTLSSRGM